MKIIAPFYKLHRAFHFAIQVFFCIALFLELNLHFKKLRWGIYCIPDVLCASGARDLSQQAC